MGPFRLAGHEGHGRLGSGIQAGQVAHGASDERGPTVRRHRLEAHRNLRHGLIGGQPEPRVRHPGDQDRPLEGRGREEKGTRVIGALVAGHAPFCWGESVTEAAHTAVIVEELAAMASETLAINPAAAPISDALRDKHHFRKHGPKAYYGQR